MATDRSHRSPPLQANSGKFLQKLPKTPQNFLEFQISFRICRRVLDESGVFPVFYALFNFQKLPKTFQNSKLVLEFAQKFSNYCPISPTPAPTSTTISTPSHHSPYNAMPQIHGSKDAFFKKARQTKPQSLTNRHTPVPSPHLPEFQKLRKTREGTKINNLTLKGSATPLLNPIIPCLSNP